MGGSKGKASAVDPEGGPRSVGHVLLLIGGFVAAFIFLSSFFLTSRLSNEDAIVEDMRQVIEAVSNETVANTESFLTPAERTADELVRLLERNRLGGDSGLATDEFFFEILRVNDAYDGIFVGRGDGSFTYVTRNDIDGYNTKDITVEDGLRVVTNIAHTADSEQVSSIVDPSDPFDPRSRPWYQLAVEADGAGVWTPPYVFFSSGRPGVTRAVSVPGRSPADALVVGIDIRIDALSTFMDQRRASPNGQSFIVDRRSTVVAFPGLAQVTSTNELAQAKDLNQAPLSFVADRVSTIGDASVNELISGSVDGNDYQFALTSLGNNPDWVVAVTAPDEDFLARVRSQQLTSRSISAIGGLISVGLLLLGGLVVNNRYRREREKAENALHAAMTRAQERDAAQERLSQTVDELARSNADLEEYAYATAHDLRTPLRAIGGYAELMLREAEDDDASSDLTNYAERIVEGYERMCTTMDNLLEHAQATMSEPVIEAIPIGPIAERSVNDFTEWISHVDAEVDIELTGVAAVDPIAMERIFQNLISNALKYRDPNRPPEIQITGESVGDSMVVHVRDNGVGIASERQDEAFRLFNRLSEEEPGSGIGLALVKKLVENHEGTIELDSVIGVGTTVTIALPSQTRVTDSELVDG